MKISKDTYLVVLTAEQAKAARQFLGSTSVYDAKTLIKNLNGEEAANDFINTIKISGNPVLAIFEQVKDV